MKGIINLKGYYNFIFEFNFEKLIAHSKVYVKYAIICINVEFRKASKIEMQISKLLEYTLHLKAKILAVRNQC